MASLGDILTPKYGKALPADQRDVSAEFSVVGSAGVMGATAKPLVREPVVLIGRKGNVGEIHLMSKGCWPIDTTYYVTVPDVLDARYLTHYLRHLDLKRLDSSTATPSLRRQDLEDQELLFPALPEQRRIVEVLEDHLSRLDAAAHGLGRARAKGEALLLSALRAHVESARSAGVPFVPVGQFAATSLGKMLDAKKSAGEPTPYLANINVRWGRFELGNLKSVLLTADEREHLSLLPGDVIVCEGGEPGRCAVWDRDNSGIAYQKALHRVRVHHPRRLEPDYLALMLREVIQSGRADRLFTGTTIKHLPQEKLRLIEIPTPEPSVQATALRELRDVSESSVRVSTAVEAAERRGAGLRRAVLAAAFEGKLTGRPTDTEVIEELAEA